MSGIEMMYLYYGKASLYSMRPQSDGRLSVYYMVKNRHGHDRGSSEKAVSKHKLGTASQRGRAHGQRAG